MELKGEYDIAAPRERVWEALNDPDVLKACIPGCESLEKTGDHAFEAKVTAKVGPVKAKFAGGVTLENINAPESYTISGEGKGGAAGFAKGSADVHLEETAPEMTRLSYAVHANVGGKLAQLGTRLIQGTSKRMADDFFARFRERVESDGAAAAAAASAPASQPEPVEPAEPAKTPTPQPEPAPSPAPEAARDSVPESAPPAEPEPAVDAAATQDRVDEAPKPKTQDRPRERERVQPPPPPKTMSPGVWIAGLVVIIGLLLWLIL